MTRNSWKSPMDCGVQQDRCHPCMDGDPEHELYDPEQLEVPHGLWGSARPVSPVVWRVTRNMNCMTRNSWKSPMDCVVQQDRCHPWYGG